MNSVRDGTRLASQLGLGNWHAIVLTRLTCSKQHIYTSSTDNFHVSSIL